MGDGPAGGRGKWSELGVPHRGWTCDEIEDRGPGNTTGCEMCGTSIRFVHYMSHARHPEALACGCICAGHMEENLVAAENRDRRMRSSARRRLAWPDRTGWHLSQNGNLTIRANGFRVTVFERNGHWSAGVGRHGDEPVFSRRRYPSARAAQLAAFDKMVELADD